MNHEGRMIPLPPPIMLKFSIYLKSSIKLPLPALFKAPTPLAFPDSSHDNLWTSKQGTFLLLKVFIHYIYYLLFRFLRNETALC